MAILHALLAISLEFLLVASVLASKPISIDIKAPGLYPQGADYDGAHGRFLLTSLKQGGITAVTDQGRASTFVEGNAEGGLVTLGILVDDLRDRALAIIHGIGYDAVVAYELENGTQAGPAVLLHTVYPPDLAVEVVPEPAPVPESQQEEGSGEETEPEPESESPEVQKVPPKSSASDIALDSKGNLYITNNAAPFVWKVDVHGGVSVFVESPLFDKLGAGLAEGLDGIVYHPKGYLLASHTSGVLFKLTPSTWSSVVTVAEVVVKGEEGVEALEDIALRADGKLVATGPGATYLLESQDNWATAAVVDTVKEKAADGPSAVIVRDGAQFVSYLYPKDLAQGKKRKWFLIKEVVFSSDAPVKVQTRKTTRGPTKAGQLALVGLFAVPSLALLALALRKERQHLKVKKHS